MPRVPLLQSLYWRITLACLGLLLVALAVQLVLVVANLSRPSGLAARMAAQRLADVVAGDLARALEAKPSTGIQPLLGRYRSQQRPVFFVTSDGRVFGRGRGTPPEPVVRRLSRLATDGSEELVPRAGVAAVYVHGVLQGRVVVLPGRPGSAVLRELGPWALVGGALSAVGVAVLLAWVTFGPAHRRLRALESAATRLGSGDLKARAPEDGADEISRVARAFNQTADALAAQIRRVTSEQELRRQLLADVSHELHTPLTTIRGYVETLRMPDLPISDADRARYLAVVDDEAIRLERLVGDLLDLARMEAGGQSLQMQKVPLAGLWARLRDRFGPAASHAGVALAFEDSPLHVTADAGRLEQALSNLLANAISFTPAGGAVRVTAHPTAGGVRIDVADTGVGLSAEDQARVFDRFYKQDGSRRVRRSLGEGGSRRGTGLGLSIVRAIAEAHGGTVSVQSTPGGGSTFSIAIEHP